MSKRPVARSRPPLLWLLLSFSGRISRRIFWPALLATYCLNFALYFQLLGMTREELEGIGSFLLFLGAVVTLYVNLAISVKRLHDIGYTGFLAIAVAIPFLNLAFAVWAGIVPGTDGANRYGALPDRQPS